MQVTGNIAIPPFHPTVPVITFSDNDYRPILSNHDGPLLITAMIGNTKVCHVFIDQGSSADILFYKAFKKVKFRDDQLLPINTDLIGFTGTI